MQRFLPWFVLCILCSVSVSACEDSDTEATPGDGDDDKELVPENDEETAPVSTWRKPEPQGELEALKGPYLQHFTDSTMHVMWQTETPSTTAWVEWGIEEVNFYGMDIDAGEELGIHEAVIENLEPLTTYQYRVVSDGLASPVYNFTTAPDHPDVSFTFSVYGDTRSLPTIHEMTAAAILRDDPDFVINVGDVVASGDEYDQWQTEHFDPIRELAHSHPYYVSIGNHEKDTEYFYRFSSYPSYEDYFQFTYANAHFIVIDTNVQKPIHFQTMEIVEEMLNSPEAQNAEWLFAFSHHPGWSRGWGHEGYEGEVRLRDSLIPLMRDKGVDAYFAGHTHDYERYTQNGLFQIITGGGGASLDHEVNPEMTFSYAHYVFHHMNLEVDDKRVTATVKTPEGEILDRWTLTHATGDTLLEDNFDSGTFDSQTWKVTPDNCPAGGWCVGKGKPDSTDRYGYENNTNFAYVDYAWYEEDGGTGEEFTLETVPVDVSDYREVDLVVDYYYDSLQDDEEGLAVIQYSTDGGKEWNTTLRIQRYENYALDYRVRLEEAGGVKDLRLRMQLKAPGQIFLIDNFKLEGFK